MIFGCTYFFVLQILTGGRKLTTTPAMGAAYGTAKSGIGISGVGTFRPDLIMKV
jgi:V-type H+-transporting ATPase proteolipid subunit